ncbi:MAG: Cytochrome c assembly protein [Chthoniobacteraceae bacterium]|nr:Cytochrome c assembly protein [Chthoniobacteraceae bacterium]
MDRLLLVISTFCFLFGFAYTMHALGARVYRHASLNFYAILTGFCFQTAFLYVRGSQLGRCPLTNLFEVLIFLSWSMVLFYLLIGPAYRLSLLGAFTSPLVFLFQIGALLSPGLDVVTKLKSAPNPWLELHAAVSVVAYGAFALACVAGVMYLAQERQLKTHHIHSIFYHLPPIHDLGIANRRLVLTGFSLLSLGLFAGFAMGNVQAHLVKIAWSTGVWLLYAFVLLAILRHRLSGRNVAWFSVVAFTVVLCTLWGLTFIPESTPL